MQCTENPVDVLPEIKLSGPVPNSYIHVSVSDLYICPGLVCLFGCSKIGKPILGIRKSLTDDCGNWETEHYNSVLEITRPRSFISANT